MKILKLLVNSLFCEHEILNVLKILRSITVTVFFFSLTVLSFKLVDFLNTLQEETKTVSESVVNATNEIKRTNDLLAKTQSDLNAQMKSIEKNVFKRIDVIENKLFTQTQDIVVLAKDLKTNMDVLTESAVKVTDNTNETLLSINNTVNHLNENVEKLSIYMDCEINSFCWPNLTQDTLLSIRNVAQDANKTYLLINESIPLYNSLLIDITKNTNEITKNVAKITKPKWYDRIISTTLAGAAIYASASK